MGELVVSQYRFGYIQMNLSIPGYASNVCAIPGYANNVCAQNTTPRGHQAINAGLRDSSENNLKRAITM